MIRDRRTNVRAYFNCQYVAEEPVERAGTGPSEGLEEKESKEFNAAGATTCTTALPGSSEARVKNGSNSEKPSKLEFDTGAGELECGAYKLLLGGSLKIAGFIEGELLTAKIP
jgi:hypothetical protein